MGLTTFKGDLPVMSDAIIAKNYLTEEELKILNNLVSGYFYFAEIQAVRHNPMHMDDYIKRLYTILSSTGKSTILKANFTNNLNLTKINNQKKKYLILLIPLIIYIMKMNIK